ncbi:Uncharacterized protein conserved in bacteria [Anaerobiospirillum thomasii]|uniref:Uncharacterized protein conserved in bacteria n=1 Tax=Anaerobiospirillum thomasii TaxID=179995 RepID=A0A2X0WWR0_9GAMM|nr:cell division protein ZapA [Anaerobiospirillum thomasii]SPT68406.1 Uncharacterized protein conserved in bacteria [Anaerobiospirillum thomasii]SPT70912.1 Uncharacterized protein conserved in bacteria [Anaerobiospirillum thomasii]
MSEAGPSQSDINISFTILGENFSVRCRKDQEEALESAIQKVQDLCAKILRDNPNLTPQQGAILCALEAQSKLMAIAQGHTPFAMQAQSTLNRVYGNLNEISRCIEKIHNR